MVVGHPSAFHFAGAGTAIARFVVSVVACFVASDDAVTAARGHTATCATNPAVFHLTGARAAIAACGVAIIAFFIAADHAIAADVFVGTTFGGILAAHVFDLAEFVTTFPSARRQIWTAVALLVADHQAVTADGVAGFAGYGAFPKIGRAYVRTPV